jgi:sterol 24-C-methyltransferase
MEDKVAASLDLPPGAFVLDAGCGVGHVAIIHLVTKYRFKIQGIDIVQHHLNKGDRILLDQVFPRIKLWSRKWAITI